MGRLRVFVPMLAVAIMVCGPAAAAQTKSGLDRSAAKKVSDAFMADLVAKRLDDALARTTDASQNTSDPEVVRWQYTRILGLCGKPVSNKNLDEGVPVLGEDIQSGSSKRVTVLFEYLCKTNHFSEQVFGVEVQVTEDGKYQVSGLSCHKPGPAAGKK